MMISNHAFKKEKLKMTINEKLIEIFNDTLKQCRENPILKASVESGIENSKMYDSGFHTDKRPLYDSCKITVVNDRSLTVAEPLAEKYNKVAVLNFADPFEAGGLVKCGAITQEECLCRCSTLYPVISNPKFDEFFYKYHSESANHRWLSDRIIYSPDMTVFKTDTILPEMREKFFKVDIITATAPILTDRNFSRNKLLKVYRARIRNILKSAMDNNADSIVLGAFGCGAFRNPPESVASDFYNVIISENYNYCFKEIVFPVLVNNKRDKHNFEVFSEIFSR